MTSVSAPAASFLVPPLAARPIVAGITLAFAAAILALDAVWLAHEIRAHSSLSLTFVLLVTNLAVVGGILAVRRPGNIIGWLLLAAGLPEAIGVAGAIYARTDAVFRRWAAARRPRGLARGLDGAAHDRHPRGLPADRLSLGPFARTRWRIFVVGVIVAMTIGVVAAATAAGPLDNIDGFVNPVVLPVPVGDWVQTLNGISNGVAVVAFLVAIGSLLLRFRRSRGSSASS